MRIRRSGCLALVLVLSACGGGGGGGGSSGAPPPLITVSGTVATGSPLAGAQVIVWFRTGSGFSTTTDANGRYSLILHTANGDPPFLVEAYSDANPAYPRLLSVANKGGTTNVTPLTSLLATRLLGEKIGYSTSLSTLQKLTTLSDAQLAAARQDVVAYLLRRPSKFDGNLTIPVDVSAVSDFVSTPFNPVRGDLYDDALERLSQSLMDGETVLGVEEHMLSENDGRADLTSVLSMAFQADCEATGTHLPSGRVQVNFKPNGEINIGSYSYTLSAGDGIALTTGPYVDNGWRIDFRGRQTGNLNDYVELMDAAGKLDKLTLHSGLEAASCRPTADTTVSTHRPSVLAQIRLLAHTAQMNNLAEFFCSSSGSFPGVQQGRNLLLFDRNGAMRVNSYLPSGYAIHLPSMGYQISATLVVSNSGLSAQLSTMFGRRVFKDGYDWFGIALSDTGVITGVDFSKRRDQEEFIKRCGVFDR